MAPGVSQLSLESRGRERKGHWEASLTLVLLLPWAFALDGKSATYLSFQLSVSGFGNISHPNLGNSCGVSHIPSFKRLCVGGAWVVQWLSIYFSLRP